MTAGKVSIPKCRITLFVLEVINGASHANIGVQQLLLSAVNVPVGYHAKNGRLL